MSSNSSNFNKINSNQNLFSNVLASIPYNSINLTRMDSDKNKLNASYFKLLLVLLTFIPLESFIGISNPKIFSSIKIMLWLKLQILVQQSMIKKYQPIILPPDGTEHPKIYCRLKNIRQPLMCFHWDALSCSLILVVLCFLGLIILIKFIKSLIFQEHRRS